MLNAALPPMCQTTLRLSDTKYQRLKELAKSKGMSVNQLMNKVTTLILADFDLTTQFEIRAARGQDKPERGLELLAKA